MKKKVLVFVLCLGLGMAGCANETAEKPDDTIAEYSADTPTTELSTSGESITDQGIKESLDKEESTEKTLAILPSGEQTIENEYFSIKYNADHVFAYTNEDTIALSPISADRSETGIEHNYIIFSVIETEAQGLIETTPTIFMGTLFNSWFPNRDVDYQVDSTNTIAYASEDGGSVIYGVKLLDATKNYVLICAAQLDYNEVEFADGIAELTDIFIEYFGID